MDNKIPDFLEKMLNEQYGNDLAKKIIEGYSQKRPVTFRVNTLKTTVEDVENVLNNENIKYEKVSFCKDAFVIKNVKEEVIEKLDIYVNGEIYLQSLSSMLPPIILDAKEGEDILDMAAAPGGKTTQIAALTNNNANITACEMNNIRAERLKYNVEKQGATSVFIMQKDARQIDDFFSFDRILLDAPCSGSGTICIYDNNLEKYFTEKLIEKTTKSQIELLKKALNVLKPGKEMIYSTCSVLQKENEDIINKVLINTNLEIVPIKIKEEDGLEILPTKIEGTLCIMPNELYEGFYIAKIKKN